MLKSLFLTTVTHFEPLASGPVASLAAGCSSLLGLFWRQLHILSPLPVALLASLEVGRYSLLGVIPEPQRDPKVMPTPPQSDPNVMLR